MNMPSVPSQSCEQCGVCVKSGKYIASQSAAGGRKRIFLGLLAVSCTFVCLLLLVFLILPWLGPGSIWLKNVSLMAGSGGIILLIWLCLTLVFHIYTGRRLPGISGVRHLCIRLFLPLMEIAGKFAGFDKTIVRRSFIKVNNEFVCALPRPIESTKLLLLIPHCMQASSCRRRLGPDLTHCANCGHCQIGYIRELVQAHGFMAAIATGGTVARRIVAETRPARIVAVACERDLTSGIQDSYPIPVFGVLNERPFGPCRDTRIPQETLTEALKFFIGDNSQAKCSK